MRKLVISTHAIVTRLRINAQCDDNSYLSASAPLPSYAGASSATRSAKVDGMLFSNKD
ncbi:hypothetical protein L1049_025190 [Liquidambar formosana]|uniref:Uncharacterized protein n=1 Tax=Liquidambar formosana TaxID=63359 RepID=A0AAP0RWE4_LIQFO